MCIDVQKFVTQTIDSGGKVEYKSMPHLLDIYLLNMKIKVNPFIISFFFLPLASAALWKMYSYVSQLLFLIVSLRTSLHLSHKICLKYIEVSGYHVTECGKKNSHQKHICKAPRHTGRDSVSRPHETDVPPCGGSFRRRCHFSACEVCRRVERVMASSASHRPCQGELAAAWSYATPLPSIIAGSVGDTERERERERRRVTEWVTEKREPKSLSVSPMHTGCRVEELELCT